MNCTLQLIEISTKNVVCVVNYFRIPTLGEMITIAKAEDDFETWVVKSVENILFQTDGIFDGRVAINIGVMTLQSTQQPPLILRPC